ncbi:phenoloxidase-activating factor 2-like isoform X2 [Oratosquilla oratoria]|uniref:phenoloxidase-activating factor 2-like isoform X2 n=1 Tax=Oratosquilla oratoria TaxID=337810 RepID=UPI003F768291
MIIIVMFWRSAVCLLAVACRSLAVPQGDPAHGSSECGPGRACVYHYNCIDGEINTSGIGVLDERIGGQCANPDDPNALSVCCRLPGASEPITTCKVGQECVYENQCGPNGTIITDGTGLFDVRNYAPQKCQLDSTTVGICCSPPSDIQPIETCPGESICIPDLLCVGEALDTSNVFQTFDLGGGIGGSWVECPINYLPEIPGVCCRNPTSAYQPELQCGVRNYKLLDTRIQSPGLEVNEAGFGEFPWQALLFFKNDTFKCGGTLVGERWVLTAAHCLFGYYAHDFRVRLGEWQVNSYDEPQPYKDFDVKSLYLHPNFKRGPLFNDVAVIELSESITYEYHINRACLPSLQAGVPSSYGKRCFASGWGKDSFTGAYQTILKKVDLPLVNNVDCQALLRKTRLGRFFRLDHSFLCAGGEAGKDSCTGDGGGPLVCEDEAHEGRYSLVGITAWGVGCGTENIPGVYADVAKAYDFINSVITGTYTV